MSDSLGDRMKGYESHYRPFLLNYLPTIVRLDGRAFHTFCEGMQKPFDLSFRLLMQRTLLGLMGEFHPFAGYVQSDEITLFFNQPKFQTQLPFNGNVNKINSLMASFTSIYFNRYISEYLPNKKDISPTFDCRVYQVPNESEAANALLWRWQDAARNSIQQVGQAYFSHTELHEVNTKDIIGKLWVEKQVDYYAYDPFLRYGYFIRKQQSDLGFEPYIEELTYSNSYYEFDFSKATNREEILFHRAQPVYDDQANLPKQRRNKYIV